MNIKGIIFDFDGTLADTLPICILSFQQALFNKLNKQYTEAKIVSYFGQTEEGIMQALASEQWEECFEEYLNVYKTNHTHCPHLFNGAKDLLDTIQGLGFKLGMVTGKGRGSAEISLNHYGIKEYFEHIETGSTTGSIKHLCMSSIIEKWGILPKETIYIGDSPTDITDAKKAGVMPISACWASTANKEELIKLEPYKLFENVLALKNWIKTLI
ncbi:MAG: HAD family hydrolase [bacterium]